jgi:phage shock protein C
VDDRLFRSVDDRLLAGVAGGVAERLDADPSIIRIVWALLIVLTGGLALVVYIVMAVVVPEAPDTWPDAWPERDPAPADAFTAPADAFTAPVPPSGDAEWSRPPSPDPDAPTAATEGSWLVDGAAATTGVAATTAAALEPAPSGAVATPPAATATVGAAGTWIAPSGRSVPRAAAGPPRRERSAPPADDRGPLIGGLVLIAIGAFFLLRQFVPALDLGSWWPIVLVGIGVALVVASIAPGRGSD